MKIVQRHYLREFLKLLVIIAAGLALILSILELIDKIDDFAPGKLTVLGILYYVFLNLPKYLLYLLPMSVLICSLFTFSQASRNRELIVIKAAGGRLKSILLPFMVMGIFFSFLAFVIGEFIAPDFAERTFEFKKEFMNKGDRPTFKEGTIWLKAIDGSLIRIELYIPGKKIAKGISIFVIGPEQLRKRIEAEEAEWSSGFGSEGIWKLKKVFIYDIEGKKIEVFSEMGYPYLESPDFFSKGIKKPEEMGMLELFRYTKKLRAAGIRDSRLTVDLNSKISYPFSNLFMMLLGISLSVMGLSRGGLFAAGLGIFISFVYWLLYTLMLSMGYTRVLPPVIATWIVPVTFGMVAAYVFRKIPE
jgi:lipopolysaccharide export system permease protein